MAILRSPEKWNAGALIYSGRRDPTWELSERIAKKLVELWDAMPAAASQMMPSTSRLGYRGVFLRAPDGREWTAFNGTVSLNGPGGVRIDRGRGFEKRLLATAPMNLLPDLSAQR